MPLYNFAEPVEEVPSTEGGRLGALIEFDWRSANYPVADILPAGLEPVYKHWHSTARLDQDGRGACVGFGCEHDVNLEPYELPTSNQAGFSRYERAQKIDPWPGEDYEGTSALAGIKTMVEDGHIVEYRWAFSLQDAILSVGHIGPLLVATAWWSGMDRPDANGIIRPTGVVRGRHFYVLDEVDPVAGYFGMLNSWSNAWGVGGRARIMFSDMEALRKDLGEFIVVLQRKNPFDVPDPEPLEYKYFSTGTATFHDSHKLRSPVVSRYVTYQEAIAAGKRPCGTCDPAP